MGAALFAMLLTNRRQRGPLAPFRISWETHNFSMARCWERPRLVDKKFGKYSRFSGNAPECPTTCLILAAIVTLGFFLLVAQVSRMLTFGAADTAPVPW